MQARSKESGGLSGRYPYPDSITIHVVSEECIASLQTVEDATTVDVEGNDTCSSDGRRESHGMIMTVIASVAVHQPLDLPPCVERRSRNSAIVDG